LPHASTVTDGLLASLQARREAFVGLVDDHVLRLREAAGPWTFGAETIDIAGGYFLQDPNVGKRIEIGLVNDPSLTATWFKPPERPGQLAIGINAGLVEAVRLIASDVFGYGDEAEDEPLALGAHDPAAATRVAERIGAFMELGAPLGNAPVPAPRRGPFVQGMVEDALQFLVLHEFSHICLGHDRGDVRLLRSRNNDLQIATFSMAQEHAADRLALRLHASMRRHATQKYPGMEFVGPTLFFGVMGIFERNLRYGQAFDTPNAHPGAYERLYRLRVYLSQGDGEMMWNLDQAGGIRLARMPLEANLDAVKFADAVAKSMLGVLEEVEVDVGLPSPVNSALNQFAHGEADTEAKEGLWREIARWLYLGSPAKVLQHLWEARQAAEHELAKCPAKSDREFFETAKTLLDDVFVRVSDVDDYSVKRALSRFN
jgi:hypothetical protein